MSESADHAKVRAVMEKSVTKGIGNISAMALSYAQPYIPAICSELQEDLFAAGYQVELRHAAVSSTKVPKKG